MVENHAKKSKRNFTLERGNVMVAEKKVRDDNEF